MALAAFAWPASLDIVQINRKTDSSVVDASATQLVNTARKLFLSGLVYAAFITFFLNFVTFASPLFMVHVYERVIPTRSYDTLYGLIVIGVFSVILYGLLDFV